MWGMCRIDAVCVILFIRNNILMGYMYSIYLLKKKKCEINILMKSQTHDLTIIARHQSMPIASPICQTHHRTMDSKNRGGYPA
jgi:hypothetical protein